MLVACEKSGRVRDAFLARGHAAVSCDLEPTDAPGPHVTGDVEPLLAEPWDLVIAHPPCTYLANSGVRWLQGNAARWDAMLEAARFFRACLAANSPRVAVENPVMHGHARRAVGCGPSFSVQPWQFGGDLQKRTCFWLVGLPPLVPIVRRPPAGIRQAAWRMPPAPDRAARRSVTPRHLAAAMADQWGRTLRLFD